MVYIIEGNMEKETVSGEYVGARRYNVAVEDVQREIDNLAVEGFDVLRTTSVENSMLQLSRWVREISKEIRNGSLVAKYTYAEFKKLVNEIPVGTDFSKIAKDHAAAKQSLKPDPESSQINKGQGTSTVGKMEEYMLLKKSALEAECEAVGLPKTGKREELVKRLLGPHPPKIWLERKRRNQVCLLNGRN